MRRLLLTAAVLAALTATPAGALPTDTMSADWGCAGIAVVGGICVNDPFSLLPI